jgi:DNA-binding NtrC family response regulator
MANILVVDDERLVRWVIRRALGRAGHSVLLASDGRKALELLDGPQAVDLLMLDMSMPGVAGDDTLRMLSEERPGLPVIVVSGYLKADSPKARELMDRFGVFRVIQKPFTSRQIADAVADCLDGRSGAARQ